MAEAIDRFTGERYVHAIFPNAVAQAPIAAANLLGADLVYDGAEAMNSLKHLGIPIVSIGTIEAAGRGPAVGGRLPPAGRVPPGRPDRGCASWSGDIGAAGVYHSLMLRRHPVARFGARLVQPGFGMADLAFDAVGRTGERLGGLSPDRERDGG